MILTNKIQPSFIYFDLDNTLLDHTTAEKKALKDVKNNSDIFSDITLEELQKTYHEVNSDLWDRYGRHEIDRYYLQLHRFEDTLKTLNLPTQNAADLGTYYLQRYPYYWQWIDGAREAYRTVSSHFDVGILTNGFKEIQKKKFEKFNFDDTAKRLVISEDTGYMKPQPEVFDYATKLANVDADSILYIGDSYTSDILGASKYGWKTAWFTNDNDPEKKAQANFVFDDFNELISLLL